MTGPIRLFVSSSPDLSPEREAVGQAVAELPISTGWRISHTPTASEGEDVPLDFVGHCDLFLVLLGADFAAPMGLEWQHALGTSRTVLAYRKHVLHSPSAQRLLRQSDVSWMAFVSPQELKTLVTRALVQTLLDQGERFGLHVGDIEALLRLAEALAEAEEEEEEKAAEPDRRRGAERGGVILGCA
jgi:hypothetical protein